MLLSGILIAQSENKKGVRHGGASDNMRQYGSEKSQNKSILQMFQRFTGHMAVVLLINIDKYTAYSF